MTKEVQCFFWPNFEGQFPLEVRKKCFYTFLQFIHSLRKRESKTSLTSQRAKLNKKDHSKQRLVTFFGLLSWSYVCLFHMYLRKSIARKRCPVKRTSEEIHKELAGFQGVIFLLEVGAQMVKCLSTMWETWVRSLGWEDSLEKEMATHSSTSSLENPMDGGAWCRLLSMGSQRVGHNWATSLSLSPLMALFSLPFKLENSTFSFCNGSYKLCSPVWTWPWRAMRSMRNRGKILKGSWQDHICALETCPGNRVVHGFGGPMHWRQGTQLE